MTEDDYNHEIDELMNIDPLHRHHFSQQRPTIEQWKNRRQLYIEVSNIDELEEAFSMDKE